jgi:hypothetical protein
MVGFDVETVLNMRLTKDNDIFNLPEILSNPGKEGERQLHIDFGRQFARNWAVG